MRSVGINYKHAAIPMRRPNYSEDYSSLNRVHSEESKRVRWSQVENNTTSALQLVDQLLQLELSAKAQPLLAELQALVQSCSGSGTTSESRNVAACMKHLTHALRQVKSVLNLVQTVVGTKRDFSKQFVEQVNNCARTLNRHIKALNTHAATELVIVSKENQMLKQTIAVNERKYSELLTKYKNIECHVMKKECTRKEVQNAFGQVQTVFETQLQRQEQKFAAALQQQSQKLRSIQEIIAAKASLPKQTNTKEVAKLNSRVRELTHKYKASQAEVVRLLRELGFAQSYAQELAAKFDTKPTTELLGSHIESFEDGPSQLSPEVTRFYEALRGSASFNENSADNSNLGVQKLLVPF